MIQKSVPIAFPWLTSKEESNVHHALRSSWISSRGEFIDKIESSQILTGRPFNLAVANGTLALALAFETLLGRSGSYVLCPSITFAATANAIVQSGNVPVFYDQLLVDGSFEPDYDGIVHSEIFKQCTALVIVHLYGSCLDLGKASGFCDKYQISLIEDCAEAPLSRDKNGKLCGSVGDASTFSFFANKVITSGEGGLVSFSRKSDFVKAAQIRDHGMNPDIKYQHDIYGSNYRMTNIQAAILSAQLDRVDEIMNRRNHLFSLYELCFRDYKHFTIVPLPARNSKPSPWFFVVILNSEFKFLYEYYSGTLESSPFESRPLFKPLFSQSAFSGCIHVSSLPLDSHLGFMLPLHHLLTPANIQCIADLLALPS